MVEIKNPFGLLQTNLQANAWWVALTFFLGKLVFVEHPSVGLLQATEAKEISHCKLSYISWHNNLFFQMITCALTSLYQSPLY